MSPISNLLYYSKPQHERVHAVWLQEQAKLTYDNRNR